LDTNVRLRAEKLSLDAINKFVALPENWIRGQIDKLTVDLTGLLSSPANWNGNIDAEVSNFRQESTAFDHGVFQVAAKNGVATLQTGEITQDQNQFHLTG